MSSLDTLDLLILQALNRNARASTADIAREAGVPERTVHNRIRKLKEGDFFQPVGVVSPKALGYNLTVDISCETDIGQTSQVIDVLSTMSEIAYIAITTGDQDINFQALFKSVEEMQDFVSRKLAQVPGIRRTRTVLIPSIVKDTYQWLPPARDFEPYNGKRTGDEQETGAN